MLRPRANLAQNGSGRKCRLACIPGRHPTNVPARALHMFPNGPRLRHVRAHKLKPGALLPRVQHPPAGVRRLPKIQPLSPVLATVTVGGAVAVGRTKLEGATFTLLASWTGVGTATARAWVAILAFGIDRSVVAPLIANQRTCRRGHRMAAVSDCQQRQSPLIPTARSPTPSSSAC